MKPLVKKIIDHFKLFIDDGEFELKNAEIIAGIAALNHHDRKELRARLLKDSLVIEDNHQSITWLQGCFRNIDKHSFRIHQVLFSPGTEIRDALKDLLKNAKKSVKLCVFSITDDRLANEIIDCHQRGVKVKIITDDQKIFDKGSDIQTLRSKGVDVKIDHSEYHMHNKFGVIDNRIVFTGSFNWTYTASKHNQENLLITTNHSIVEQFTEEFERLWQEMYKL
ncbi:DUF1669 domain-containing protein [Labilibacter sediminis]|nr:DUF1669 domain-containing protein [Labilibacter sediminis]